MDPEAQEHTTLTVIGDVGSFVDHLDWSFVLVLAAVILLVVGLVLRHRQTRRRQRRAEKRARRKAYKEWLNTSGLEMPETVERDNR